MMNKDDFDFYRLVSRTPQTSAVDLLTGLQDRERGRARNNVSYRENIGLFAEEQLVRKGELKEMRCEMPGMPRSTFLMVFSPDGTRAASTHGNHNIYVTDLRSGKNIKTLIGHPRTPWCIAFHPTSNQIVASGCLGGQVRIWDLSGGSEVWTTSTQSVIASLAFHPNDRVLVIATFNQVYFWDWNQPEPFVHAATSHPKEQVRYVAFDKLGHKLITGIANSPQTRWERVRAPVPVPRQERCASPYRRRITQRLVAATARTPQDPEPELPEVPPLPPSEGNSVVPERERRITRCYRNLVREYELLVQRYLQLYRPPTMIDRGTDPMEPSHLNNGTQTANRVSDDAVAGPSGLQQSNNEPQPSTSHSSQNLLTPSRLFIVSRKPPSSIRGTQTKESRKHKAENEELNKKNEKRLKREGGGANDSSDDDDDDDDVEDDVPNARSVSVNVVDDKKVLVVVLKRLPTEENTDAPPQVNNDAPQQQAPSSSSSSTSSTDSIIINSPPLLVKRSSSSKDLPGSQFTNVVPPGRPGGSGYNERFSEYIRANRERLQEFRRFRLLMMNNTSTDSIEPQGPPPSEAPSEPSPSRAAESNVNAEEDHQRNFEQIVDNIRRTAEEEVRSRILPIIQSVPQPDRAEILRLFENSRENVRMRFRQMYPRFLRRNRRHARVDGSTDNNSSSSDTETSEPNPNPRPSTPPPRASSHTYTQPLSGSTPQPVSTPQPSLISTPQPSLAPTPQPSLVPTPQPSLVSTPQPSLVSTSQPSLAPPPRLERDYHAELEQLVTSLLNNIESNDDSAGNDHYRTPPVPVHSTSARTRPNRGVSWLREAEQEIYSRRLLAAELDDMIMDQPADGGQRVETEYIQGPPGYPQSRRFFSHRVSAFMPTRVNYTRARYRRHPHYAYGSGRSGTPRTMRAPSLIVDEIIDYAARERESEHLAGSEAVLPPFETIDSLYSSPESGTSTIGSIYSNIVQDLESSLNDVRNIRRAGSRSGETAGMLSSFSERLDNIMNQSDTILRNLRSTMSRLPNTTTTENGRSAAEGEPTRWNLFGPTDPSFYVRDIGAESLAGAPSSNPVASDHTYPRDPWNPNDLHPAMSSLHLTITHIQKQARLLRRQVESIERIDRAMLEVAQLQLMRQLVIEMIRHVRTVAGDVQPATGMSSVRQMMAGTRISDSGPARESRVEEDVGARRRPQPGTSSSTTSGTDQPSTSTGGPTQPRRSSNRKTYPPSRYVRLVRHQSRRPTLVRCLTRFERCIRQMQQTRTGPGAAARPTPPAPPSQAHTSPMSAPHLFNYSQINSSTLSMMTIRLERLLNEQMTIFTRAPDAQQAPPGRNAVDLAEHIMSLRLHGCVMRMTRVLGNSIESNLLRNMRSQGHAAAATQDGAARYGARHTLSLILDGMSRYIEELGNNGISNTMRMQIHSVLAMSLLLTELLLLQVVDSIPPPSRNSLDPEREALARRIDDMCTEMLQTRMPVRSAQLTRSLRLMRLTMRHANRALDQTYMARRNAMLPRQDTDRRQLLGTINRCLRHINRTPVPNNDYQTATTATADDQSDSILHTINELLARYSNIQETSSSNEPAAPSGEAAQNRDAASSNNDNSDDETEDLSEPGWFYFNRNRTNNVRQNNSTLYRTNNVNLVPRPPPADASGDAPQNSWNVPSIQVNAAPVPEAESFAQRLMSQRQIFAERVSELRSNQARVGLFRPRFLHPLYASVNPFDADLDDPQREQMYDSDMVTTVTPNHRIQAWDISNWTVPSISNSIKNIVVGECRIHNDASVDIATDGTILVTLLPSGGYLNVTNRLGVYSLRWETLGQCLYTTSFEQNAVSVSLSPMSRHLVVGFASRRVSIVPTDQWVMARIYKIEQKDVPGDRLPVLRELEQSRENRINCIRWLPTSGQGLIYATNTGQLVILS